MFLFSSRKRVGCLGKLPLAADFSLETRLGGAAEAALDDWLRTIPRAEGAGGEVPPEAAAGSRSARAFVILDGRGRSGIAGLLRPSMDAAGRKFPFSLHIPVGGTALAEGLPGLLPRIAGVWEALADLDGNLAAAASLDAARKALRATRIALGPAPGRGSFAGQVRGIPLPPFLEALLPGGGSRGPGAADLVRRFARYAGRFDGDAVPAVALRAPFTDRFPAHLQLGFWLEWLAAISGRHAPPPAAVFVPAGRWGHDPRGLWILHRNLIPQDGEPLLGRGRGHEFLLDLIPEAAPAGEARP